MKAALLTALRHFEIAELPEPALEPDEVLVEMRAVGICGSDVHYWNEGGIGPARARYPQVLGHEPAGVVVACGKQVKDLRPGDRVAVEPGLSCGHCRLCLMGRQNCCPNVVFLGSPGGTGAFQEYLPRKAHQCHLLPESLSLEEGALLEPFSVAVHALRISGFTIGQSAAVIGGGSIGLAIAIALRAAGAGRIVIGESLSWRREKARALGFAEVGDTTSGEFEELVRRHTQGEGAEVVFEAAGEPETFHLSVRCAAIGGTAVLVGICGPEDIALPMHTARRRELKILLSRRDNREYAPTLTLAAQGRLDMKSLITNHYALGDVQKAFEETHARKPGVLKSIIRVKG